MRPASRGFAALAVLALYDELWSGVAVVAAPGVEQTHGIDHTAYTFWVFALPMLSSTLIEAPIAFVSDRISRRFVLAASLGMLAVALLGCALATSAWSLSVGLTFAGAASGIACSTGQAQLVTSYPAGAHRALSRWTAFAAVGDILAPLLLAATLGCGGTHRAALAALALLLGLQALLHAGSSSASASASAPADEGAASMPLGAAVRDARGTRAPALWWLLFAASCCTLLDEVIVAVAALHLHLERGWPQSSVAAAMSALSCGVFAGALATERSLQRWSPRSVLIAAGAGSASCIVVFVVANAAPLQAIALFLIGVCAAPNHALVMAGAYELAPSRPGLVNALAQLFVVVEVCGPLLIGELATRYGLTWALLALMFEPLVVALVAGLSLPRDYTRR